MRCGGSPYTEITAPTASNIFISQREQLTKSVDLVGLSHYGDLGRAFSHDESKFARGERSERRIWLMDGGVALFPG